MGAPAVRGLHRTPLWVTWSTVFVQHTTSAPSSGQRLGELDDGGLVAERPEHEINIRTV